MTLEKNSYTGLSASGHLWMQNKVDTNLLNQLKHQTSHPEIICTLMAARNIPYDDVVHFLSPTLKHFLTDPFLLKDMHIAVERIIQAIYEKESITIYGDYDVDGATSTALFIRFFRMLGIDAGFYIPDRQLEGYGPNKDAFEKLASAGTKLIITVDCGTLSFEPISAAKKNGISVIVVDHHAGADTNPECTALINPNRKDETSHLKHLAAVGVSFMVCVAVTKALREQNYFKNSLKEPDLMSLLDIVALGTVCDVVNLSGLNRAFVYQGLKVLANTKNKGLRYLMDLLKIDPTEINTYHLGFMIGPRINAGGRIGTSSLGTLLLSSEDDDIIKNAADELNLLNEERKLLQDTTLLEADLQVKQDSPVIVVSNQTWHPGVIGIVAGKLKDKYHKPTFVIAINPESGEGKASARSIHGFDIGNSIHLAEKNHIILQGGGHQMAGGFSILPHKIPDFEKFMCDHLDEILSITDRLPKRYFDAHLTLNSLNFELYELIEKISPFGSGNPSPKFLFSNVTLKKIIIMQEKHIRCFLEDRISGKTMDAVIFNAFQNSLGSFLMKHQSRQIDILGSIKKDTWKDRVNIKLFIEDVRLA